ncbi:MAG: rubredoxin [Magnetococcales bacterium]|nr:rubredoxin [Magnetococcales bacterium]
MLKWRCIPCKYIYDEAEGIPDEGIPPETQLRDLPEGWRCPGCGVGREGFEPLDDENVEVIELKGSAW